MAEYEQYSVENEYYTPKYIFDALGVIFDMDVAAPVDRSFCHVPAKLFITSQIITKPWVGFVWCNPPWSGRGNKDPWIDRMIEHGDGILLTPDRTSAPWWQKVASKADYILQVNGKIKFIKQDGITANQPGTGTTLFAFGDMAKMALAQAYKNKLGVLFAPLRFTP